MRKRSIALLAVVLAAVPAFSQDSKTAATAESECGAKYAAADKNGDGYLTHTEISSDVEQIPSTLAKEGLIGRPQYLAACVKMLPAQARQLGKPRPPSSPSAEPTVSPETKGELQPQGRTGPLETQTGGAPAESPIGKSPPGMQAAPEGSSKSTIDPDVKKDR